jgi:hypothetical protein
VDVQLATVLVWCYGLTPEEVTVVYLKSKPSAARRRSRRVTCWLCGSEFTAYGYRARYCPGKCRREAQLAAMRKLRAQRRAARQAHSVART